MEAQASYYSMGPTALISVRAESQIAETPQAEAIRPAFASQHSPLWGASKQCIRLGGSEQGHESDNKLQS